MSYRPLIIKSEFESYVKIGANVSKNGAVETAIKDMQEFEFKPTVPLAFYTAITGTLTSTSELQIFLDTYVKPYLILGSYEKFLLWHGRNISQFGLRENNEDTSNAISDKARAEMMADIRRKTNITLLAMNKHLSDVSYTLDGVVYDFNTCEVAKGKPKFGFKQVGKNRNNNLNNNNYPYNRNYPYYGY